MIKSYWKKGDRARLAELSYTHKNNLYEILARKRGVSKEKALTLEKASALLGYSIPFEVWLFNKSTLHPAFYGRPTKGVLI